MWDGELSSSIDREGTRGLCGQKQTTPLIFKVHTKIMSKMVILLLALAIVAIVSAQSSHQIGFGVQRLRKNFAKHNHHLGGVNAATTCPDVEQYWYADAVVDNFAPADKIQKWANNGQRYWLNKKHWAGANAPIFVFIGGEGEESCSRLGPRMYVYDLAQQHSALMVNVEHRFYGQSLPTENRSTANLSVLSSDQALADLANIIAHIKKQLNSPNSRVITVGGSYPGNLSAYFRLKYPSVTHGSIASSAPVKAQTNFKEYMDVVGESIRYFSGSACYDALREGADAVAELAAAGPGSAGMKTLEKDFGTCTPIASQWDLGVFYSNVMGNLQGTVQYNNEHAGTWNVTDVCNVMAPPSSSGTPAESGYDKLVKLTSIFEKQAGATCQDVSYEATVAYLADIKPDPSNAARPWVYQTCNEFGFFQTCDSPNQPFHAFKDALGLDFSRKMCFDAFDGWNSDPNVKFTNEKYGGVNLDATKIVFTSGTIDPWHALGVTNYTHTLPQYPSELPVYILGTAHCNDLYAPNPATDPESLTLAREVVAKEVDKWLHTDSA